MANILIVSSNLKKWVKNSGGVERTATLAEAFPNDNVTFLTFSWDSQQETNYIAPNLTQIVEPTESMAFKKRSFFIRKQAKNNYDIAFDLCEPYLKHFKRKVSELAKTADLLILDHYATAPLIQHVEDIPVLYNSHNAEIVMANQMYPDDELAVETVKKMEGMAIAKASAITYCSQEDLDAMKEYYDLSGKELLYVPNGSEERPEINPQVRRASKDIIFVGSGHPPNSVACKNVVDVARIAPGYNFILCGDASNSVKTIPDLPSNVIPLGRVSDEKLDDLFSNSFAFINLMESGAGTHLKMMKALSYGIPIITSSIGARGFSDQEVEDTMLIANNSDEALERIVYLGGTDIYPQFANKGFELSKNFSWTTIKKNYAAFVKEMLNEVELKEVAMPVEQQKKKVLIYSIIRNNAKKITQYNNQVKAVVKALPQFDFYLSIYENDSDDGTKERLMSHNWSFFKGVSIVSEDIGTRLFGSTKDEERVHNLAIARNKGITGGGFIDMVDYVLMVEGDNVYTAEDVVKLFEFEKEVPGFDVVSAVSLRSNNTHYDWWATRKSAIFNPDNSELDQDWKRKSYGEYYSTSNGLCLYRAKPFQEGVRHHWINAETKESDCEMVVLCQNLRAAGYKNIYISYKSFSRH
jgi:glycosyltransferase involved in cell wall biosynthesis